ncbi:hypothetical protein CRYUN_Cryun30bG0005700 [Craigia yunnanensis]
MQGGSSGIGYGLKYRARCISDVKADTDHTSFITGTLSLREENEVHLIRLSSGGTELIFEGLFSHPNEIWDLASCPFDQRISLPFSLLVPVDLILVNLTGFVDLLFSVSPPCSLVLVALPLKKRRGK